ncbi:MAG: hypothetical protein E7317_08685 [Clostridiales bacterium]|nr:hypothetical protein [Clostridiales bacterium]
MRTRLLAALTAALLTVSPALAEEQALPEPADRGYDMILGEHIAARPDPIAMQYVSGDGSTFSTITRSILRSEGNTLLRNALDTYFTSMRSLNRMSFIPEDLYVLSADDVCGIVTVDLSPEAWKIAGEVERFSLYESLANTLLSLDNVTGVNILVGGAAQQIQSLPLGVITSPCTGITPAYAQISTEVEYFLKASTSSIDRSAVLYFPSGQSDCFLPEIRTITFDAEDYTSTLLRALRIGSRVHETAADIIPDGMDLLMENPSIRVTTSGERVLSLELSPALLESVQGRSWELIGSLTLTVTSFIPELDAVQFAVGDTVLTVCEHAGREITFLDGLVRRRDFTPYIAGTVTLYLPTTDGRLSTAEKSISWERSDSPGGILRLLLTSLAELSFVEGLDQGDLLGISVDNGVAVVNLSADFYRACQELNTTYESVLIYAMVNTLTQLSSIREVQFLIEGSAPDSLGGDLYLRGTLMPNPGIVTFPQIMPVIEEASPADDD